MITVKFLEIRDRNTFIPAFVFKPLAYLALDGAYLIKRAGYGVDTDCVMLGRLDGGKCHYDCYCWGDDRTFTTAHNWITEHWDEIKTGDVIDVEFILGETKEKKLSEAAV